MILFVSSKLRGYNALFQTKIITLAVRYRLTLKVLLIHLHIILSISLVTPVINIRTGLRFAHQRCLHSLALTPRAIMHNLVRKQVAVNAEMLVAGRAFITTAGGRNALAIFLYFRLFLFRRYFWKGFQA